MGPTLYLCIALCILLNATFGLEGVANYIDHKLVEITNLTQEQDRYLESIGGDVWASNMHQALIHLTPFQYALVHQEASLFSNITLLHENLQELIDKDTLSAHFSKAHNYRQNWHNSYHSWEDIKYFFEQLARDDYDDKRLMKYIPSIGTTVEGRDIFAVKFTAPSSSSRMRQKRKKVWIQCLIHAREWISGSVCQYFAQQLVDLGTTDLGIQALLNDTEIIMVPVVNPDGYAYTWKKDRLWRKNRNGVGVDLNRNFGDHWGKAGSSKEPGSLFYCGASPDSEPETQAIINYFQKNGKIDVAIDYHSYSQLIMRPPGWVKRASPHERHLKLASDIMASSMYTVNRRRYLTQKASELYENSGSAVDYFYSQGTRYSITVELPPSVGINANGDFGFVWGPEKIKGVCEENWQGFLAFVDFALQNPLQ